MRWKEFGLGILATLIIWQGLAAFINRPVFPPPAGVLLAFGREFFGALGWHFLVSTWRVIAATMLAIITAVPAGLVLGQNQALDRLFSPIIYILNPIPKIVFLPVLLVLLGAGDLSKIILIAFILFFQILVVVRDAAAELRPELLLSVRSIGAGRRALLRYVYFPAALPAVLTAFRISIGTAVAVLFFAESFATSSGLGYYIIVDAWGALKYPEMYAGVLAMSLLGLMLYFVTDNLEKRLCPWKASRS
jgi:ABC-type nitrate/sulfonate/bicarbonate transport system permease component